MSAPSVFFAGGGTGGHIYPALAVAEKIAELNPDANIHFFCSSREIDSEILSKTDFSFTQLPATGFSFNPAKLIRFVKTFQASANVAKQRLSQSDDAIVIGVGGFVSAPVCRAAYRLGLPVKLLNVDIVPGKANKLCARWADEVFVQFRDTVDYFARRGLRATVTGCPLRKSFENPNPQKAKSDLGLDGNKKILLIYGGSSGAKTINDTIISLLDKFTEFSDDWQIVHITGKANEQQVKAAYSNAKIEHKVIGYYDNMADLLAVANLVIGRSGAVSVAEYAAAKVPVICMPYPHHKDMHQYLNAEKLVDSGAAIIVDDLPDLQDRAEWLWDELEPLMKDNSKLSDMKNNYAAVTVGDSTKTIAQTLLSQDSG
ncbi:MAG: UDP-N-acetylglucosamine--N-acetylmuramyl-(pentapeptide) pyrophosphoryl-undecaprenol N-acetylglucosamine transferase [Sedimentisphaerales bacterium]|nr:UDP-N-acetylglucosamine--N-acetylmuramyl-(pentapeptide) pyrophosphoryl-undecaprenol N-acetylglucosamine transferase [Sedimentisphaerales bacterium]